MVSSECHRYGYGKMDIIGRGGKKGWTVCWNVSNCWAFQEEGIDRMNSVILATWKEYILLDYLLRIEWK